MNNMTYLKDVVTLQLDENKCTAVECVWKYARMKYLTSNSTHAVIQNR